MPSSGSLTVFFEDPFWVGVFERVSGRELSACKVTFGAEPKEAEVWQFILDHYRELSFSPAAAAEVRKTADNPKRRQRNAGKEMERTGISTRSQEALQLQREAMKTEHREISREEKEAEEARRYALKQEKRKEKQKGH